MEGVYDAFRISAPFKKAQLPPGEEVQFNVIASPKLAGLCSYPKGVGLIELSHRSVGTWQNMGWVMAHEMIHLSQMIRKTETSKTKHNAEFRRIAARVCKHFGFDLNQFGY